MRESGRKQAEVIQLLYQILCLDMVLEQSLCDENQRYQADTDKSAKSTWLRTIQ